MKKHLVDLVERAGATFAQAFLAAITVDASGITQVDALKVALGAGLLSVGKFLLVQANAYLKKPQADVVVEEPAPEAPPAA
jgi:hypothetical protein